MIKLEQKRFVKAAEKARSLRQKLRISMVSWRQYDCLSQNTFVYRIRFETRGGQVYAECSCAAGVKNTPCYHIAACYTVDQAVISMRQDSVSQREAEWRRQHPPQVPAALIKPQPPSLGRLNGYEL